MNKLIIFLLSIIPLTTHSQDFKYYSLDPNDPIDFHGDYIVYHNDTFVLGPRIFFIDGRLNSSSKDAWPYVFSSVNDAAKHLVDGSEDQSMTLLIAPWVYWIDDPDDPEVRTPKDGSTPYGLKIKCEWLRFYGLNQNPSNVVLACNRGQTLGAKGNFTMFRFSGDGTSSENITFGNYCNVDLEFPLNPELNRKKRSDAIVQAQLIHCDGDKIITRNTRFISRLNLCNFVGAKRILFDNCHMESTDDALCGTGVYKNCSFEFFSSKPFYHTTGTGAVFLNCDINTRTSGKQYFTKANGQLAVIDTRFHSKSRPFIGWRDFPPPHMKNYQSNVTLNGEHILIGQNDPENTLDISKEGLLKAYKFMYQNENIYNTYNLLKGNDDWDPEGIKSLVLKAEKEKNTRLTNLPVQLRIMATKRDIETGKDSTTLQLEWYRFGNYKAEAAPIDWKISESDQAYLKMEIKDNGNRCRIIPTNMTDKVQYVILNATTKSGLQAAIEIVVKPAKLAAPDFASVPKLKEPQDGILKVIYQLEKMPYADESCISWYRCNDARGSQAIEVAVSRQNKPSRNYTLSTGDIGYHIMVKVAPKHMRSDAGPAKTFVLKKPVKAKDVKASPNLLQTDFINVSVKNQTQVLPGFWRFAHFDTSALRDQNKNAWYVGSGSGGNTGMFGLLQSGRYASMGYTPVGENFGDMKLDLLVTPFKTAGQGFSVAPLYMDVLIKYDPETKTGFGLRFIRQTTYANTVDAYLVEYDRGRIMPLTESIPVSCYRPQCKISLQLSGGILKAYAECLNDYNKNAYPSEVKDHVDLEAKVNTSTNVGFGIEYNGGSSAMINEVKVLWEE